MLFVGVDITVAKTFLAYGDFKWASILWPSPLEGGENALSISWQQALLGHWAAVGGGSWRHSSLPVSPTCGLQVKEEGKVVPASIHPLPRRFQTTKRTESALKTMLFQQAGLPTSTSTPSCGMGSGESLSAIIEERTKTHLTFCLNYSPLGAPFQGYKLPIRLRDTYWFCWGRLSLSQVPPPHSRRCQHTNSQKCLSRLPSRDDCDKQILSHKQMPANWYWAGSITLRKELAWVEAVVGH